MELEDQIKGIVYHSMNFVICRLIEKAFLLAFERGLSDLKDLVEPNSLCETNDENFSLLDVELELLDSVEDVGVKKLMVSVNRVLECSRTYLMINNLNAEDLVVDLECFELSESMYYSYEFDMETHVEYEEILWDMYSYYMVFQMVISHCACLFMHKKLEAYDETDSMYFDRMLDLFGDSIETEDKNARLLLSLVAGLQADVNDLQE